MYGDYPLFGIERSKILRDIFAGQTPKTPSRTGNSYRGHGLEVVGERSRQKYVSNLTVVTNDVHAKVAEDNFRMMKTPFHGTFFYWEYSHGNSRSH